jgi:hypothetical protein
MAHTSICCRAVHCQPHGAASSLFMGTVSELSVLNLSEGNGFIRVWRRIAAVCAAHRSVSCQKLCAVLHFFVAQVHNSSMDRYVNLLRARSPVSLAQVRNS